MHSKSTLNTKFNTKRNTKYPHKDINGKRVNFLD